ncbi:hypothetical protein NDU88_006130 [Pleurodeles waltl]|uniref:Uncharacterized protein n=1 Tax=Pleurodeles waltl TaxID=8319 RepID=A0AAV7N1F6_PLEWA|nr:hypothetical protein NDU88_006130 [Pleurodeles waltl]
MELRRRTWRAAWRLLAERVPGLVGVTGGHPQGCCCRTRLGLMCRRLAEDSGSLGWSSDGPDGDVGWVRATLELKGAREKLHAFPSRGAQADPAQEQRPKRRFAACQGQQRLAERPKRL